MLEITDYSRKSTDITPQSPESGSLRPYFRGFVPENRDFCNIYLIFRENRPKTAENHQNLPEIGLFDRI